MIYGYIRVSTDQQNTENQKFEITEFAKKHKLHIDKWVIETISSRTALEKRKLNTVLSQIQRDDILISTEISRLGRNILEVMSILKTCLEKGCQVWTIKESYQLGSDIQSKLLAFAFSLSAEIERNLISQRTKETLARLKAEGKTLGRPKGSCNTLKLTGKENEIKQLLSKSVPKLKIARMFSVNPTTLYKFIKLRGI